MVPSAVGWERQQVVSGVLAAALIDYKCALPRVCLISPRRIKNCDAFPKTTCADPPASWFSGAHPPIRFTIPIAGPGAPGWYGYGDGYDDRNTLEEKAAEGACRLVSETYAQAYSRAVAAQIERRKREGGTGPPGNAQQGHRSSERGCGFQEPERRDNHEVRSPRRVRDLHTRRTLKMFLRPSVRVRTSSSVRASGQYLFAAGFRRFICRRRTGRKVTTPKSQLKRFHTASLLF